MIFLTSPIELTRIRLPATIIHIHIFLSYFYIVNTSCHLDSLLKLELRKNKKPFYYIYIK